jgi:hypothetical protein
MKPLRVPRTGDITPAGASTAHAVGMLSIMRLPEPRGPLSEALFRDLATRTTLSATTIERGDRVATAGACALTDEDLQISLAGCYELREPIPPGASHHIGEAEWARLAAG